MPPSLERDSASEGSECCSLSPRQVARLSTKGAPSTTICYHKTTPEPFKEVIRNHGRYLGLLRRSRETLHEELGRDSKLYRQSSDSVQLNCWSWEEIGKTTYRHYKINKWFTYAFYCGLSSEIRTMVRKEKDNLNSETYEMVETANEELKARYEP